MIIKIAVVFTVRTKGNTCNIHDKCQAFIKHYKMLDITIPEVIYQKMQPLREPPLSSESISGGKSPLDQF